MTETGLNNHQKALLKVLMEHAYYLTTREIAQRAKVSWVTADKYLQAFDKLGWIMHAHEKRAKTTKDYWKAYPPTNAALRSYEG